MKNPTSQSILYLMALAAVIVIGNPEGASAQSAADYERRALEAKRAEDAERAQEEKRRQARPRAQPAEATDRPAIGNADRDREGAGDRAGNTASLQASLRRQIAYCWRGIEDLPQEDQIDVEIGMTLKPDGTLDGNAELVSPRARPVGRSGLAVDLALRAVRKCEPYKLPQESYDQWKDIVVTIAPSRG